MFLLFCCWLFSFNYHTASLLFNYNGCVFLFRREHRPSATFSLSADLDTELLDLDDQLSPPASFYTGTGGKPPLSFSLSDSKPPKRYVKKVFVVGDSLCVYHFFTGRGSFSQSTSMFPDVDGEPGSGDWMGFVDPNEPRYCLCNQVINLFWPTWLLESLYLQVIHRFYMTFCWPWVYFSL